MCSVRGERLSTRIFHQYQTDREGLRKKERQRERKREKRTRQKTSHEICIAGAKPRPGPKVNDGCRSQREMNAGNAMAASLLLLYRPSMERNDENEQQTRRTRFKRAATKAAPYKRCCSEHHGYQMNEFSSFTFPSQYDQ